MFNKTETKAEDFIFAMQDRYGKFSVTLKDIISCVLLAEENGYLPEIASNTRKHLFSIAEREEDR